ncbi:MAG TPA: GAF domain-containing protein [Parafilimonas sp.]|nr:GAF domain-containing protein [Parafilimonas sp.]
MEPYTDDSLLKLDVRILNSDIKLMLLSKSELKYILNEILTWLEVHSENEIFTSILLYNKQTNQLFNGSAPALPERYNAAINGIMVEASAGSCGTAAFHKKQVIVQNIAVDPLWKNYKEYALKEGLQACWSTPVMSRDNELLGTFAIYYKTPSKPSAHDLMLINEIAGITSSAIEARRNDFERMITP